MELPPINCPVCGTDVGIPGASCFNEACEIYGTSVTNGIEAWNQALVIGFDPERRLVPLLATSTSPPAARAEVEGAIRLSGQIPGIFTDEDDALEVRWLFGASPTLREGETRVLNVTFTDKIEAYVYDRTLGEIVATVEGPYSPNEPGVALARLVEAVAAGMPGDAVAEIWGPWS